MIQELIDNHFLIIKNFIDVDRAKTLSKEFKEFCEKNDVGDDPQVPNTPSKHNYISFLELLCEKTPEVSKIIEETVLPTYCYARVYKNGDVLTKHTDRDACEVSMTLHLDGDKEWEIYVQTPSGKEVPVRLNSGDALLYLGCDAPHWRNEFQGNFYSQVFLHYVKSKGQRAYAFFDNKDKNKFQTIKMNNENYMIKSSSPLEQFVTVFEDAIPLDLCDSIIHEYLKDDTWSNARVGGGNVNTSVRNCLSVSISSSDSISKNSFIRKDLDNKIFEIASKIINDLIIKFDSTLSISKDTGYDLLRYDVGGFYKQHTDSFTEEPRAISCSFCLNDDYEGGEFAFFNRELVYKLKKGSIITFPSNFMYPHEIMPVIKGTRYSIITWFI